MRTRLFVVSDLHLGGEPGTDGAPGFQMCPPANQARLARFIASLPGRSKDADVRLVIAGDIVDFLAEKEFAPFTLAPAAARAKLSRVLGGTRPIWTGLGEFLRRGGALTLMLGNHDIELCLPGVRQLLYETLGEGRIEFLYDNEAFTLGPVLVEHGNRYDEWNAVRHGALRRVRSQLSRGLTPEDFPSMPGSRLVVEVMNRLKAQYSWIDLLKPETAGVLPILAALGAGSVRDAWQVFRNYRQTREVEFDHARQPRDETFIAAGDDRDQRMFQLAEDIAAGGDATKVSAVGEAFRAVRDVASATVREYRRTALFKALRALVEHHRLTFEVDKESSVYLDGAAVSARRYKVVVYGHTHLVKRVPLAGAAVYLNTGTWADLMSLPRAVFSDDATAARTTLDRFVADLEADTVAAWRRAVPTFARMEVDGDSLSSADVYFFNDDGSEEAVTTKGVTARLAAEALDG